MNPDPTVTNASTSDQIPNPSGRTSLVSKTENVIRVSSGHKRNGKIARLPKAIRDKINRGIDDGRTYPQIIKDLGEDAKDLKPGHFSEWRKGGYEDYLRHQEWRDDLRILRESGSEMTEFNDGPKFQETLTQIALTEIFRVLQQRELKPDSLNFIRLFNALARLNREALGLRKYNDLLAKEQAELKKLEIGRKMSTNEHRAIVDQADQIFRMPRPRPAETSSEPCSSRREEAQTNDRLAPSNSPNAEDVPVLRSAFAEGGTRNTSTPPVKNRNSEIQNPSRPSCVPFTSPEGLPSPWGEGQGEGDRAAGQSETQREKRPVQPGSWSPIQNQNGSTSLVSKIENPEEYCLDCRHPLPSLTPEGKRPNERCEQCGVLLPPPGTCTRPSSDKCHHCGATLPHRLPNGRRPKNVCHNCGCGLGRETDEDIQKYAEE